MVSIFAPWVKGRRVDMAACSRYSHVHELNTFKDPRGKESVFRPPPTPRGRQVYGKKAAPGRGRPPYAFGIN